MASDPDHTDELKTVNEQLVAEGETLPVVRLKDGARVQTGTVAMMLENVKRYDAGERGEVERQLEMAVPTLFRVGLFDLFSPEEWCAGNSPGRRFVGELALRHRTRG